MVTASSGERSRGMPACWDYVLGMLHPGCLWPRTVTVMDAIAWAGRQHLLHGPFSLCRKQESKEQGSRKLQTSLLPVPAFLLHTVSPPWRKRGYLLLSLPEWDDLSMSHLRHDMDPCSLGNSAQLLAAAQLSTSLTPLLE